MNFPKRLLMYVILLVTLNIFCFSFVSLLGWIFDLSNNLTGAEATEIAPFLAGIIVALPIWVFTWRFAQKTSNANLSQSTANTRHLYLNVVLGISIVNLALFTFGFFVGLQNLFSEFRFGDFASLIVWLPVFLIHIRPAQHHWFSKTSRGRIHEIFLNVTFLVSLILIFISSQQIVHEVLNYFLRLIFPGDVLIGSNAFDYNSADISRFITGAGLWTYSWYFRIKSQDSGFRTIDISVISVSQIFIFFVSIFVILGQFIELLFGLNNSQESLIARFEFLPEVFSYSIVSIIIWSYYSSSFLSIKFSKKFFDMTSPIVKWIYRYSVRAIAVLFLISSSISGLSFLLGLPIQFISPDLLMSGEPGWETGILSASISALIMGFGILKYINSKIGQEVTVENQRLKVEKSYIYFLAILFLIVLLGALIAMLTIFINDLLSGEVGISTLNIIRWPLSFSLTSLIMLLIYKNNILNQLKLSSSSPSKELKVEILPGDSMEKFKDEINEQFKVKKWKSVKSVGQFKINKKQIENLPKELEKIGSDKDFILVEGKGNEIWVYYYN